MIIRKPDDMHLHLRNGEAMKNYAVDAAKSFKRAIVMPNTVPPVVDVEGMLKYKSEIIEAAPNFEPLMTFKLNENHTEEAILKMKEAGVLAAKLYPKGVTTNSEDGSDSIEAMYPVFEILEEHDIVLSIHGEDPDATIFDRERAFLPTLVKITESFPDLRIILEHVSTKESVELIEKLSDNVVATITPQHLLFSVEDMLASGMKPELYCKPILQSVADKKAIAAAVLGGSKKFFFGTDSAPHLIEYKLNRSVAAGAFSTPVALSLIAEFFINNDKKELLEPFTSEYGADFYRLPYNEAKIEIVNEPFKVEKEIYGVIPMCAGKTLNYSIKAN